MGRFYPNNALHTQRIRAMIMSDDVNDDGSTDDETDCDGDCVESDSDNAEDATQR